MSIIITSPIAEFPGTITLVERPTLEMVANFRESQFIGNQRTSRTGQVVASFVEIMAFTERWDIKGQPEIPTPITFYPIPAIPARDLLLWLMDTIEKFIAGDEIAPKVLAAGSTLTPPLESENQKN